MGGFRADEPARLGGGIQGVVKREGEVRKDGL
jgi:hypothetical protein